MITLNLSLQEARQFKKNLSTAIDNLSHVAGVCVDRNNLEALQDKLSALIIEARK